MCLSGTLFTSYNNRFHNTAQTIYLSLYTDNCPFLLSCHLHRHNITAPRFCCREGLEMWKTERERICNGAWVWMNELSWEEDWHVRQTFESRVSVSRLGDFLKDIGYKFSLKSSRNIGWLLGRFLKMGLFNLKLQWILFGQLLEKWGYFFILTSGHTDCRDQKWANIWSKRKLFYRLQYPGSILLILLYYDATTLN